MAKTSSDDSTRFSVYCASDRDIAVEISDPIRKAITDGLEKGPMSASQISELTGRNQSTLAPHLEKLTEEGVASCITDTSDGRKRIYSLSAGKVIGDHEASAEKASEAKGLVHSALDSDKGTFFRAVLKAVMMDAEAKGIDVTPLAEDLGRTVAEKLVVRTPSKKTEDIIGTIEEFYERNDLGDVCIYTFLPLTIIVKDTSETQHRCDAAAAFSHGLFVSMLELSTRRKYRISEHDIFGTGNNYYKFVIEQL